MACVLYPGSFDPIHNGHVELAETASGLFDEVVIAALVNPSKGDGLFDLEERMHLIEESLKHLPNEHCSFGSANPFLTISFTEFFFGFKAYS